MARRLKLSLKKKTFGMVGDALGTAGSAVKNVTGGALEGVGKAASSKVGGIAGAIAGAVKGAALGPLGVIGGAILGSALTKGVGKGLKNAGQDLQMG